MFLPQLSLSLSCFFIFSQRSKFSCWAIKQHPITPLSCHQITTWCSKPFRTTSWISEQSTSSVFEKGYLDSLVGDQLCPIHLNLPTNSDSVYTSGGAASWFTFCCVSTQCGAFLSSNVLAGNLLLSSHFPTITEAYKLPRGRILDRRMFFYFQGAAT